MATALLAVAAALKLAMEFYRLVLEPGPKGAIDLRQRFDEVQTWFAGGSVYDRITAVYPPATFLLLWPLIGWLDFGAARWLWAATSVAAMIWFARTLVRQSGATGVWERWIVALSFLAMNATGVTVGNGQLILHLLPPLVTGILVLAQGGSGGRLLVYGPALILFGLVKPNVAAPFFWLTLFIPRSPWPAVAVVVGYLTLTSAALAFQPLPWDHVIAAWSERAREGSVLGAWLWSYANLHSWFAATGWERWNTVASLLLLTALGVWTRWHRHIDPWVLLGVTGIVARVWTYHGIYDGVLIVLPIVALFRIVCWQSEVSARTILAGVLLTATVAGMLCPARLLLLPPPVGWLFTTGHAVLWLSLLLFLGLEARREKRRLSPL
jgi:hypothetical protein